MKREVEIRKALEARLHELLMTYEGWPATEHTLNDIKLNVAIVLEEIAERFQIGAPSELPFLLETKFDKDGFIIVRAVSRKVS